MMKRNLLSRKLILRFLLIFVAVGLVFGAETTSERQKTKESRGHELIKIIKVDHNETILAYHKKKKVKFKLIGVAIPEQNNIDLRMRMMSLDNDRQEQLREVVKKSRYLMRNHLKYGNMVYIEFEGEKTDAHGRRLVYLYLPNQKMLNTEIIKWGLSPAFTKNLSPEKKTIFESAYEFAVRDKVGLSEIWEFERKFNSEASTRSIEYSSQKRVSVMTYNLENLFDTEHDEDKGDHTYLPLEKKKSSEVKEACNKIKGLRQKECFKFDWSEQRLKTKMERLQKAILQVNNGKGPDVLMMQEVENYRVLDILNKQYLQAANYELLHVESRDYRGIDVAVFSRLKLAEVPLYHEIPFKKKFNTRGLLETTFILPNRELMTVFTFHLAAQFSPAIFRAKSLNYLTIMAKRLPKNRIIIAGGDTNISAKEEREDKILDRDINKFWKVSHLYGCQGCKGTYYYDTESHWSFFDMFYFRLNDEARAISEQGATGWQVSPADIKIVNGYELQNRKNKQGETAPNAYREPDFSGVSDHFPLLMELHLKD